MHRTPSHCPACDAELQITEMACVQCRTQIRGQFARSPFDLLSAEEEAFLKVFLRCRGVLREVERMLGYSYPTVRGLLDEVLETLGLAGGEEEEAVPSSHRQDVLQALQQGQLSVEEALQRLEAPERTAVPAEHASEGQEDPTINPPGGQP